jgi:hypothetical protein
MNARTARILKVLDSFYRAWPNEKKAEGNYCLYCHEFILNFNKHHLLGAVLFQNGVGQKEFIVAMRKLDRNAMHAWRLRGKERYGEPHISGCISRDGLAEILELIPYEEELPPE